MCCLRGRIHLHVTKKDSQCCFYTLHMCYQTGHICIYLSHPQIILLANAKTCWCVRFQDTSVLFMALPSHHRGSGDCGDMADYGGCGDTARWAPQYEVSVLALLNVNEAVSEGHYAQQGSPGLLLSCSVLFQALTDHSEVGSLRKKQTNHQGRCRPAPA